MANLVSDSTSFLTSFVEHLLHRSDSVTFYEAIELLDVARKIDRIGDAALHAMVLLHDAPHATDGARDVLVPYIRAQSTRRAGEFALSRRPLTLADHNKTARADIGASLVLHLAERRASGFLWHVELTEGPVAVARRGDRADAPATAFFTVVPQGAGCIDIALRETFEGRHPPQNRRERVFALRIYADPPTSDLAP